MNDWSSRIWETVNGQLHSADRLPYFTRTSNRTYSYDKNKYNRKDFYTVYKDNHNLTIMDYCLYINKIGGPLSWRRDGDEFYLNPNAKQNNPDAHNTLHSVEIKLVPTVNQSTAGSVFCRESRRKDFQHQPYTGHLDTLGDFMVMVHNTFYATNEKSPVHGKILIKGQHGTALSMGMKQASTLRKAFIDDYIRLFHTNKSIINYHTLEDIGNSNKQNDISQYLGADDYYQSSTTSSKQLPAHFIDAYRGKQDKRYKFPINTTPFKEMAAYKYLCVTRGIPALELRELMLHDLVRSYNGHRYFAFKVESKELASLNLRYKAVGGFYNSSNHKYYRPNIIPTQGHTFKELESNPGDYILQIGKDGNVASKGKDLRTIDLVNTSSQNYVKDPEIRLQYALQAGLIKWANSAYPRVMFNWKLPQDKAQFTTLQASQADEKVVGQDVIYLKPDCYHKEARKFSNGKQIRPHPKKNYGYNVKHGSGKDTLYVFEAPVDALSFIALHSSDLQDKNFTVLSLGGAGKTKAINGYIKAQHAKRGDYPHVIICFDDDHGGYSSINGLTAKYLNKKQYVDSVVKPANAITKTPQDISVMVPGVARFKPSSKNYKYQLPRIINFHREVPAESGLEWKDYNDVLQGVTNDQYLAYHSTLRNKIIQQPDTHMNIAQYGQYQMNVTMDDAIGTDKNYNNARNIADFFASYYALDKSLRHEDIKLNQITPHNCFIAQMRSHYDMLSDNGKEAFHRLMDTNSSEHCWGGQSISPHDLYLYSSIYQECHNKPAGQLGVAKGFDELVQNSLIRGIKSNLTVAKFPSTEAKAFYIWSLLGFMPYLNILQKGYAESALDKGYYKSGLMMTRDAMNDAKNLSNKSTYEFITNQLGELSALSLSYKSVDLHHISQMIQKASAKQLKNSVDINNYLRNDTKEQLLRVSALKSRSMHHASLMNTFRNQRSTMHKTDKNRNGQLATNQQVQEVQRQQSQNRSMSKRMSHHEDVGMTNK